MYEANLEHRVRVEEHRHRVQHSVVQRVEELCVVHQNRLISGDRYLK